MRALVFGVATFGLNHDWHFSWHGLKEISEVISSDVLPHFIANLFFHFSKGIFFPLAVIFKRIKLENYTGSRMKAYFW